MNCLVPDGGSFIRAYDAGILRSLSNREFIDFLESLEQMPWSRRSKAQGDATRRSHCGDCRIEIRRSARAKASPFSLAGSE